MFQRLYQRDEILFSSATEIREVVQYMQTVKVFLCQENIRMGHRISKLEQAQPIAKGAAAPVAFSSKKEEIHPSISAAISGTIPPNHSHSREDVTPPLGSFAPLLRIPKTPTLHTLPTRMVPKPPNFPPPESAKRGNESADGGASTHPKSLAKKRPRTKNTSPSSYWI